MTAQIVDPFLSLAPAEQIHPGLTLDELKANRADIYAWDHDDRDCLPQLLAKALEFTEARAAVGDTQAIRTLQIMALRATSGIPFGEPDGEL